MKHIIYQVLPRLWGKGKFSDWTKDSFDYLKSLGVDTIWMTGIPRHASGKDYVKGSPGSPYSIEDWYDVNPYLSEIEDNRMDEFKLLINRVHAFGLKLLIDFIPNHVARDYVGSIPTHEYCDYDWTDTRKVDWYNPATVVIMADILKFWAGMGVDGFRCDMAELIPPDKLSSAFQTVKEVYPELLFVGEVYDRNNYRRYIESGFDLLYDKSGAYDILKKINYNCASAENLTWNWQFLGPLQDHMLNFLENHDEQRLCSSDFAGDVSRIWAMLAFSLLFNNASFLLYFGQELGEKAEESENCRTSIFNWTEVASQKMIQDYISRKPIPQEYEAILDRYSRILNLAREKEFSSGGTWDLGYCNCYDKNRIFSFVRFASNSAYLVVCNFSDSIQRFRVVFPRELSETSGIDMPSEFIAEVGGNDFIAVRIR